MNAVKRFLTMPLHDALFWLAVSAGLYYMWEFILLYIVCRVVWLVLSKAYEYITEVE